MVYNEVNFILVIIKIAMVLIKRLDTFFRAPFFVSIILSNC